jgi:hypothetical protein
MFAQVTPGQTAPLISSKEPGDKTVFIFSPEDQRAGVIYPYQPLELFALVRTSNSGIQAERYMPIPHYGLKLNMVNDATEISVFYRQRPGVGAPYPLYTVYADILLGTDDYEKPQYAYSEYYDQPNFTVALPFPSWGGYVHPVGPVVHKIPPYSSEYRIESDCHGRIYWLASNATPRDAVPMRSANKWRAINRTAMYYDGFVLGTSDLRHGTVLLEFR